MGVPAQGKTGGHPALPAVRLLSPPLPTVPRQVTLAGPKPAQYPTPRFCITTENPWRAPFIAANTRKSSPAWPSPPFPAPPAKTYSTTSRKKDAWLEHQTTLINEKHLNMIDKDARKYLAEQRDRFLSGEEFDKAEGYVPPRE